MGDDVDELEKFAVNGAFQAEIVRAFSQYIADREIGEEALETYLSARAYARESRRKALEAIP